MLLFKIYFILYFSTLPCSVALQKLWYNDIFERTKKAVAVFFSGWYMYYLSEILRVTENLKISELNLDISWSSTAARFSTKILSCLIQMFVVCCLSSAQNIGLQREESIQEVKSYRTFCLTKLQHVHSDQQSCFSSLVALLRQ